MPLVLDAPVRQTADVDTLKITSFAADLDGQAIHIVYDEGYSDAAGNFTPVTRDNMVSLTGSDFLASIGKADAIANAMPTGSVSVYGALKQALYDELRARTDVSGSIT